MNQCVFLWNVLKKKFIPRDYYEKCIQSTDLILNMNESNV